MPTTIQSCPPSWSPVEIAEVISARPSPVEHTVAGLTEALRSQDSHTWFHSLRVMVEAAAIGRSLGFEGWQLRELEIAAVLHDVGKLALPTAVLRKSGPLTAKELELVRSHPESGWRFLRKIPGLKGVAHIVLHHHERVDGRGYPAGLRGDDIPLGSRVLAVADALDAILSERTYCRRRSISEASKELRAGIGSQFDGAVVEPCLERLERRSSHLSPVAPVLAA